MTEAHDVETLACPQCGATPVVDWETNIATCEYCGSKFLLPEEFRIAKEQPVEQPVVPAVHEVEPFRRKTRPGVWTGWAVFCILFGAFGASQFGESADILDLTLGGAFILTGLYCLFGRFASKQWDLSLRAPAILFYIGACFLATCIQEYAVGNTENGWIILLLGIVLIAFCGYMTITRLKRG